MSRFKIGQKVVSLKDWGGVTKGSTYFVDGFSACPGCGTPTIHLREFNKTIAMMHDKCGKRWCERDAFAEHYFAPLQSTSDAIKYKLTVAIPELEAIKERLREMEKQS